MLVYLPHSLFCFSAVLIFGMIFKTPLLLLNIILLFFSDASEIKLWLSDQFVHL